MRSRIASVQMLTPARITIAEMDELEDSGSADMLTQISRGVDKWLWFVEAHQQS